jgi:hypothetical protein
MLIDSLSVDLLHCGPFALDNIDNCFFTDNTD